MANEIDEAEAIIRNRAGLDNDDIGALLSRLVRAARTEARRLATIEARLAALEATGTISAPSAPDADAPPPVE